MTATLIWRGSFGRRPLLRQFMARLLQPLILQVEMALAVSSWLLLAIIFYLGGLRVEIGFYPKVNMKTVL